jgi:hypothetical protein
LELSETRVTSASLGAVGKFTTLEWFIAYPCDIANITNGELLAIGSLQNLKVMGVGPHVTAEEGAAIQQALPKCSVRVVDASGNRMPLGSSSK